LPGVDPPAYTLGMQERKNSSPMRLAVTGGGGYIGRHLCRMALAQGAELTVLGRSKPKGINASSFKFISYDLSGEAPNLKDVDAVIHLASAGLNERLESGIDLSGTRALAEAAKSAGVPRFIFVSSQSACADAPTSYGRGKFAVEKMLDEFDSIVVRPGLVCGGEEGGVYGKLCGLVKGAPLVPVTCASTMLQPIHVNQICDALLKLSDLEILPKQKAYYLGAPTAVLFGRLLKKLAWTRFGRRLYLIPLPITLVLLGVSIARIIPGLPNIPRERVLGLTDIELMDSHDSFMALGIKPHDVFSEFSKENPKNRRQLLREADTLLRYITRRRAGSVLRRRYSRAIEAARGNVPIRLPWIVGWWPPLLRLFEPIGGVGVIADRLAIAMSIAETTPEGAREFCLLEKRSWLVSGLGLVGVLVIEVILMPIRMLLGQRNS
jgi:nucleoside-diphosphate-sugar epimerase